MSFSTDELKNMLKDICISKYIKCLYTSPVTFVHTLVR